MNSKLEAHGTGSEARAVADVPDRRLNLTNLTTLRISPGGIKQFRIERYSRIRSTSLSVISSFVRS